MIYQEGLLGFGKLSCRQVFTVLRAYSTGLVMNDAQIAQAAMQLGVIAPTGSAEAKLGAFYETLKVEGGYDLNRMVVLGIMLSKGNPNEKAKLYFDQYDTELTGNLTRETFVQLVSDMIAVVLDSIPKLVSDTGKFAVQNDIINTYIFKLSKKRKTATDKLAEAFYAGQLANSLTQAEFIDRFVKKDDDDYSQLSTAYGTRAYLNWIHAHTPDEVLSKATNIFAALLNQVSTTPLAPKKDAEEVRAPPKDAEETPGKPIDAEETPGKPADAEETPGKPTDAEETPDKPEFAEETGKLPATDVEETKPSEDPELAEVEIQD